MSNDFFALVSRMKYIDRWALMRNTDSESLSQHSFEVAIIAHALAVISNTRLKTNYDANKVALIGLYHDTAEILTGDMPTPVKYYSTEILEAFKKVEEVATEQIVNMLPDDLKPAYEDLFFAKEEDAPLWRLNKAADKISALIKCIEEEKAGNREFTQAKESTLKAIHAMNCEPAEIFLAECIPSFELTLDELKNK